MKHINIAMENMKDNAAFKDEESRSIIERIIEKTGDPKIAAVLALDLFLVGVDTVSLPRVIIIISLSYIQIVSIAHEFFETYLENSATACFTFNLYNFDSLYNIFSWYECALYVYIATI